MSSNLCSSWMYMYQLFPWPVDSHGVCYKQPEQTQSQSAKLKRCPRWWMKTVNSKSVVALMVEVDCEISVICSPSQMQWWRKQEWVKFHSRGVAASWLDLQSTFLKDVYRWSKLFFAVSSPGRYNKSCSINLTFCCTAFDLGWAVVGFWDSWCHNLQRPVTNECPGKRKN